MLTEDIHPTTLVGVKRLAKQLKKTRQMKHAEALDLAARSAGCTSFRHAQRTLPMRGVGLVKPYLLLTIYWHNNDSRPRIGRETLRIELSVPILELCDKSALKYVRGFGDLRMVADDHFVCDDIANSQEYARRCLCTAERSLRFMEHTGLRPYRNRTQYPIVLSRDKLPNKDHATNWVDLETGQFVLVDEPYGNVPNIDDRAAWAGRTGWRIEKTDWPGMYSPYDCDLYVAVDGTSNYDLDALVAKVGAMPPPLVANDWSGEFVSSWETYLSPMAQTAQDKRRARCKGMINPQPSKSTVPYNYDPGCSRRRPAGKLGIEGHKEAGRVIKCSMRSEYSRSVVYTRMSSLRSELENWMALEIGRGQLEGPEFFEVYYRWTDDDQSLLETFHSANDVILALRNLAKSLRRTYPDCAPLRQQLRRVEMSISLLEKAK